MSTADMAVTATATSMSQNRMSWSWVREWPSMSIGPAALASVRQGETGLEVGDDVVRLVQPAAVAVLLFYAQTGHLELAALFQQIPAMGARRAGVPQLH